MADCIPIQFATHRASTRIQVHRTIGEQNENTAVIDKIRDVLLAAGWTLTSNVKSSGSVWYLIPVPTFGSGTYLQVLNWLGLTYVIYDTSAPIFVPTGPTIVLIPAGSTQDDSFRALCATLNSVDWSWSYTAVGTLGFPTITVRSRNDGTAGNGHFIGGILGVTGFTGNGGWTLTSAAANATSSISFSVYGGGGVGAGVWYYFTLNGHTTPATAISELFNDPYWDIVANDYQVAFYKLGDNRSTFMGCAPYVVPDYVSAMGYTAFVVYIGNVLLGDPAGYMNSFNTNNLWLFTDGTWRPGATIDCLLRRYDSSNPLVTSFGKPLALPVYMMLQLTSGDMAYVGAIWDAFVEQVERNPEIDRIEYANLNWRTLFTQGGGSGGFNFRTTGTMWLAIGDPI